MGTDLQGVHTQITNLSGTCSGCSGESTSHWHKTALTKDHSCLYSCVLFLSKIPTTQGRTRVLDPVRFREFEEVPPGVLAKLSVVAIETEVSILEMSLLELRKPSAGIHMDQAESNN